MLFINEYVSRYDLQIIGKLQTGLYRLHYHQCQNFMTSYGSTNLIRVLAVILLYAAHQPAQ